MRIYLLRHGIAEQGFGKRDSDRALTDEGKRKLRELLSAAARAGVAPSLVLTSPYLRALETSRIAVEVLGYQGTLIECAALTPDSSPQAAWGEVRLHSSEDSVLLVGHEPLFSALSAYLLGQPNLAIDFKKGAMLCVDLHSVRPQPSGILKWYLTPKFT